MGDTRVRFKCAKAVRLCAARGLHVRFGTKPIPSQRALASSVGKTPSFSFCQVDMYALCEGHERRRHDKSADVDTYIRDATKTPPNATKNALL